MNEYKGCANHAIMVGAVIAGEEPCPFCEIERVQGEVKNLEFSFDSLKRCGEEGMKAFARDGLKLVKERDKWKSRAKSAKTGWDAEYEDHKETKRERDIAQEDLRKITEGADESE